MTKKLTLSLDAEVVAQAEKYSTEKGLSLSKVVEDYLRNVTMPKPTTEKSGSILELRGILGKVPKDFDYREERYRYLMEKYK